MVGPSAAAVIAGVDEILGEEMVGMMMMSRCPFRALSSHVRIRDIRECHASFHLPAS